MKQRGTVLITDGVNPILLQELKRLGFQCDYQPHISLKEVHDIIHQYEGIVVNSKIWADKTLFDKAIKLIFLARLGSGMERIDQDYAQQKGIHIINSPQGNRNAVAEHALGMLLALSNHLARADREVRQQHWDREKNRGFEIQGKTIGIIGFGHTGSTFAKKLAGLEMNVLAYDKYKEDYTRLLPHVQKSNLSDIQAQADIISFHLPLNPETQHIVNQAFLQQCKKGVIILNTSRGGIVHTQDLVAALEEQQVGGACLDVFENEKPHTFTPQEQALHQRLYQLENVILSPHIAGWTQESKLLLSQVIIEKLEKILGE